MMSLRSLVSLVLLYDHANWHANCIRTMYYAHTFKMKLHNRTMAFELDQSDHSFRG